MGKARVGAGTSLASIRRHMERRLALRPQRVLLVDDAADLRTLWRLWLTVWGFAVDEARNGAEAVAKARTHPPDLILMDLAMPVLDGLAAKQLLAADPVTADVPVLGLSNQVGLQEGSDPNGFLLKPAEADQLLALIRTALGSRSVRTAE